jgi:hypothetical protein
MLTGIDSPLLITIDAVGEGAELHYVIARMIHVTTTMMLRVLTTDQPHMLLTRQDEGTLMLVGNVC